MTSWFQCKAYPLIQDNVNRKPSQCSSYQFADPVQDQVDNLLADGIMASGVIIGCVFLSGDQLLRMEELPVSPCAHFIYNEDKDMCAAGL